MNAQVKTAAHTPGPWTVGTSTDRGALRGQRYVLANLGGRIKTVAACSRPADAALIAAAPDLLAALRPLADIPLEGFGIQGKPDRPLMGWNGHTLYVRDVLAARAALAKAECGANESEE